MRSKIVQGIVAVLAIVAFLLLTRTVVKQQWEIECLQNQIEATISQQTALRWFTIKNRKALDILSNMQEIPVIVPEKAE